jgi:hypothetical protein
MQSSLTKVAALLCLAVVLTALPAAAEDAALSAGPQVGERIPAFRLPDQAGTMRTFTDLTGPEGLLLLFYRTADW